MISAKVILDSISPQDHRLTTFELRYPKFIHGEFMTHRVFSRNAASSRAIPISRYLEEVRSDDLRATPVFWGKNQKGMQAAEELEGAALESAQSIWREAALAAASKAVLMEAWGAHKQIVNRILEPFLHITVVCTATEYMNFFGLRLDAAAQPEMRALAEVMWTAYRESMPALLNPGQWHLPYVESFVDPEVAIKVSVARVARISYKSFETGKLSTIGEDVALHDRLLANRHMSPFEHQATPYIRWHEDDDHICWKRSEQWRNFLGWCQYRATIPGEDRAPLPMEYRE